jgi:hypothetical protein
VALAAIKLERAGEIGARDALIALVAGDEARQGELAGAGVADEAPHPALRATLRQAQGRLFSREREKGTEEEREARLSEMKRLRAGGMSFRAIGDKFGISWQAAQYKLARADARDEGNPRRVHHVARPHAPRAAKPAAVSREAKLAAARDFAAGAIDRAEFMRRYDGAP